MKIELSLRISQETDELSSFVAQNGLAAFSCFGRVRTHQGESVIMMINIDVAPEVSLDQALGKGVAVAAAARSIQGFPAGVILSLWTVISASQEFVGIVVQEDIVKGAAQACVNLVFSVYYTLPPVSS